MYAAALIDGMTTDQFQLTFRAKFLNRYARPMIRFAYRGDDNFFQVGIQGDAKFIFVQHVTDDRAVSQSPITTDTNAIPGIGTGTNVWFRYESDGSTITGYCIASFAQPTETDWSNTNPFVTYTGLPNNGRGGIGLGTRAEGGIEFDNVTLRSDPDGDGAYDVLELHESFDNDGDNFRDMAPEHDASGNLTFDGLKRYTYDAFNRLVKVENAFKDPDHTPAGGSAGDLAIGSTVAEYVYDGNSRRIRKDTYIGGELDNVEHFYCIGDTLVETRNGSSQVIQQHVWHSLAPAPGIASGGGHYIDSLAEVSNNTNPGVDDTCDQRLFTLQDQQYNILALVDTSGGIVERYEYGLYGERTVMNATYVVLHESAYNINCGFQGLYHDVETGLIYNRARMLNPRLKRFNQRDPLGYPDGMNTYAAYHVMRGGVDPWGLEGKKYSHEFRYGRSQGKYSEADRYNWQKHWQRLEDKLIQAEEDGDDYVFAATRWQQEWTENQISKTYPPTYSNLKREIFSVYRKVDKWGQQTNRYSLAGGLGSHNQFLNGVTTVNWAGSWISTEVNYYVAQLNVLNIGVAGHKGPRYIKGGPAPSDSATAIPAVATWKSFVDPTYNNTVKPFLVNGLWKAPTQTPNCAIEIKCRATCAEKWGENNHNMSVEWTPYADNGEKIYAYGALEWPSGANILGAANPTCAPIDPQTKMKTTLDKVIDYYCPYETAKSKLGLNFNDVK